MKDVVFFEAFDKEAETLRAMLPDRIEADFTDRTIQASGIEQCPASLISIRTQSLVPKSWHGSMKGLLTRSAGFDHVIALPSGIPGGHLVQYCSQAVAEQALMMCLMLMRKASRQAAHFRHFDRDRLTGIEIKGKTAVVIGVGNIGGALVDLLTGVGMNVLGVDIDIKRKDLSYVDLNQAFESADAVFVCAPLTDKTKGMVNRDLLIKNNRKAVIVNVSRGEITPLKDMGALLEDDKISGLAMDVFADEVVMGDVLRGHRPITDYEDHALLMALQADSRVLFTPHNAFNTDEALVNKCQQTIDSILYFMKEGRFIHQV